jgi:hypothetical protein
MSASAIAYANPTAYNPCTLRKFGKECLEAARNQWHGQINKQQKYYIYHPKTSDGITCPVYVMYKHQHLQEFPRDQLLLRYPWRFLIPILKPTMTHFTWQRTLPHIHVVPNIVLSSHLTGTSWRKQLHHTLPHPHARGPLGETGDCNN